MNTPTYAREDTQKRPRSRRAQQIRVLRPPSSAFVEGGHILTADRVSTACITPLCRGPWLSHPRLVNPRRACFLRVKDRRALSERGVRPVCQEPPDSPRGRQSLGRMGVVHSAVISRGGHAHLSYERGNETCHLFTRSTLRPFCVLTRICLSTWFSEVSRRPQGHVPPRSPALPDLSNEPSRVRPRECQFATWTFFEKSPAS